MARKANPRRVAYDKIRSMRGIATEMAADWSGPRKKVQRTADGRNARLVTAPPEDQPENCIADWKQLAADAERVARWASLIKIHAEQQIVELRMKSGDL